MQLLNPLNAEVFSWPRRGQLFILTFCPLLTHSLTHSFPYKIWAKKNFIQKDFWQKKNQQKINSAKEKFQQKKFPAPKKFQQK